MCSLLVHPQVLVFFQVQTGMAEVPFSAALLQQCPASDHHALYRDWRHIQAFAKVRCALNAIRSARTTGD